MTDIKKISYRDGIYFGELSNGIPHGKGKITLNDGSTYEGDWKLGYWDGNGVYKNTRNQILSGYFIKGIFKGHIEIIDEYHRSQILQSFEQDKEYHVKISTYNTCYTGSWKNGMKNGYGRESYLDSSRPPKDGFFINDQFIGKVYSLDCFGNYTNELGTPIKLKSKNGIYSGRVHVKYPNGETFEGTWTNSKRNGLGQYNYRNGDTYIGPWEDDERTGSNARYIKKNGFEFKGSFKNNKFDGPGTIFYKDKIFTGFFKNGLCQGEGECAYKNGGKFLGNWNLNTMDGKFTFFFDDGSKLDSIFKENIFQTGQFMCEPGIIIDLSYTKTIAGEKLIHSSKTHDKNSVEYDNALFCFTDKIIRNKLWMFSKTIINDLINCASKNNNKDYYKSTTHQDPYKTYSFSVADNYSVDDNINSYERTLRATFDWTYRE